MMLMVCLFLNFEKGCGHTALASHAPFIKNKTRQMNFALSGSNYHKVIVIVFIVILVLVLLGLSSCSTSTTMQNLEILASKLTELLPFWFSSKKCGS